LKTTQNLSWKANCFPETSAKLVLNENLKTATITITTGRKENITCYDWYFIATKESYFLKLLVFSGNNNIHVKGLSSNEIQDIKSNGFRIFQFEKHILSTLAGLWKLYKLFFWAFSSTEEENKKFLGEHMNMTFVKRKQQDTFLSEDQIESGDLLEFNRLKGEFGFKTDVEGLQTLEIYFSGATVVQAAVAMWIDGELFVLQTASDDGQKPTWPAPYVK
jgi:hypothetical protein